MVQSKTERDLTLLLRHIKSNFNKVAFRRSDVIEFMEESNIPSPIFNHAMNFGPFEKAEGRCYKTTYNYKKGEIPRMVEWIASVISDEAKQRHSIKKTGDDGSQNPKENKSLQEIVEQDDISNAIQLLKENGFTISVTL